MINAEFLGLTANQLAKIASKLEDENAKLRKLAYGFRYCSKTLVCKGCPLYDPSEPDYCRGGKLEHELGINEN